MFKHAPIRSHRSKGLKVKHVLQICVLAAVCIWLIYQVKHSHEKRREFETKDEKVVEKMQSNGEIHRIGRKDIPRITDIITDGENAEKHEDEDDEKEGEEEENKHEDDELEREDVRLVDTEEEREIGDEEIDEHEAEKIETENEHEDEVDEDKEREGKEDPVEENHTESEESEADKEDGHVEREENEDAGKEGHTESEENENVDKEDHVEGEVDSNDQENVGARTNTREAQEVLYQADDASSEVAHDVQSIPETENVTIGRSNKIWGNEVNFGQEHETKTSDNAADKLTKAEVQPREDVKNGTSNAAIDSNSNQRSTQDTIVADEFIKPEVDVTKPDNAEKLIKPEVNLTKPGDADKLIKPTVNLTKPDVTDELIKPEVNLAKPNVTSSLQSATLPEITSKSSVADGEHSATSNGTETTLGSIHSNVSHSSTVELPGKTTVKLELPTNDKKLQEAEADANKAGNVNTNTGESLNSHDTTLASSDGTNVDEAIEAAKDVLVGNEKQGEKAGSENQHDPIDAADTNTITQEETESNTDLDTLPEIRTEVQKTEDTVAD